MNTRGTLTKFSALLLSLSACWDGDPRLDVGEVRSQYLATATVPEFAQCNLQDREALGRTERAIILPTAECADGQCRVSGRGYPSKDGPFHISYVNNAGECALRELENLQFTESYSVEVSMNRDYLRSLGLSRSEIDSLAHRNFAGSRHGDLRASWIDEINYDVKVTIFYDTLPTEDEFIVSGQTVSFDVPPRSTNLEY